MPRYGMIIDAAKCNGCHNCFISCKDEFYGNAYPPYSAPQGDGQRWLEMRTLEHGSGTKLKVDFYPVPCQHCEPPTCMADASGAVVKEADGVVCIDPEKAKGRADLVKACPFGRIFWNETLQLPQKCTFCIHMTRRGETTTRCAECCPLGAIVFGDLEDETSEIARLARKEGDRTETLGPAAGAAPLVRYLNLPKPFLAGEVVMAGSGDCAEGARVCLIEEATGESREAVTDFLGDFEFRDLVPGRDYCIEVSLPGYRAQSLAVHLETSKNIGLIALLQLNQ